MTPDDILWPPPVCQACRPDDPRVQPRHDLCDYALGCECESALCLPLLDEET